LSEEAVPQVLAGKRGLVMGIANRRSIAWGVAEACHAAGAEVALSYAGERLAKEADKLSEQLGGAPAYECDVTSDESLEACFGKLGEAWEKLDFLVHCIAFADKEDLHRSFVETSRAGYALAQDISSYSLVAACRHARPLLEAGGGGSVVTMTYLGGARVVQGYNVMGVAKAALESSARYLAHDLGPGQVRVNAVSAGPIKTLAARGIRDFSQMLGVHAERAPLKRNITVEEVADATLFLSSDMGRGVTGQVLYVDAGYCIL
jgi:enoyl-[acyl-carrier protein] reductase I